MENAMKNTNLEYVNNFKDIFFEDVEAIFEMINLPDEAENAARKFLLKHWDNMPIFSNGAYDGEFPTFKICKRKPLTRLAIVVYLLAKTNHILKSKCVDEKIIEKTFQDVTLRVELYLKDNGKVGLSVRDACCLQRTSLKALNKLGVGFGIIDF